MILSFCKLIRFFVGWIDLFILTLLLYFLSFLPNQVNHTYYPRLFRYWCTVFARALHVSLIVHDKYMAQLPKQYIVISNHPSAFEDIGMPILFNAHYLAKYEVQHWWWVGRISRAAGTLFFKREDKEDRHQAFNLVLQELKSGKNIGLYPEGGCKGRRVHLPFHHNVFELSIQSGVPIIPVFIHYEAQAHFEWQGQTLLKKIWEMALSPNKNANYYIHEPLDPKHYQSKVDFCTEVEKRYIKWQSLYLE